MNLWKFDNANSLYYALIDALAKEIEEVLATGKKPVIGLSAGNTMIPLYRLVSENEDRLHVSQWICFNIDEYYPLTPENESRSFVNFMNTHFYGRLEKGVAAAHYLDGRTQTPDLECAQYEEKIAAAGGIDLTLLGLGMNGHIAFNEPGSEFNSRTRMVDLHAQTLLANFQGRQIEQRALTLGIANILESKKIYIVALGKSKTNAVMHAIKETESRTCPASVLRRHPNATWFLDQDAAQLV